MNWRRHIRGAWSLDALKGASAVWLLVLTVLVIIVAVRGEDTRGDVTYVTERVEAENTCTRTDRTGCRLQLWWMLDAANDAQKAQLRHIRPRPRDTVSPRVPRIVPARPTPRARRLVRPAPRRTLAPVTVAPAPAPVPAASKKNGKQPPGAAKKAQGTNKDRGKPSKGK